MITTAILIILSGVIPVIIFNLLMRKYRPNSNYSKVIFYSSYDMAIIPACEAVLLIVIIAFIYNNS